MAEYKVSRGTHPMPYIGERFGKWTVVGFAHSDSRGHKRCQCLCDCGSIRYVEQNHLQHGKSRSCGCGRMDSIKTHGLSSFAEYDIWLEMKRRCELQSHQYFIDYGGRGITVCTRWNDVKLFLADMGPRPTRKHTLERLDNDKGYSPENCRWATRKEQANNRRSNAIITLLTGETMTLAQAAAFFRVKYATLRWRIINGWPQDQWSIRGQRRS